MMRIELTTIIYKESITHDIINRRPGQYLRYKLPYIF